MEQARRSGLASLLLPLSLAATIAFTVVALERLNVRTFRLAPRAGANCGTCRLEQTGLPFPIPDHGIVETSSSIFWPFGDFVVLDLDKRTIAHIETDRDADGKSFVRRSLSAGLKNSQLDRIVGQAKRLWNPPHAVPSASGFFMIDMIGTITLYDGARSYRADLYFSQNEFIEPLSKSLGEAAPRLPPDPSAWDRIRPRMAPEAKLDAGLIRPNPIFRVPPEYPAKAKSRGYSGYVDFQFTIEADGSVGDAKVVAEVPQGYGFAAAAEAVFPQWKFAPHLVDGKPARILAGIRVSFKSAD